MITAEDIRKIVDLNRIYKEVNATQKAYEQNGGVMYDPTRNIKLIDEQIANQINEIIKERSNEHASSK